MIQIHEGHSYCGKHSEEYSVPAGEQCGGCHRESLEKKLERNPLRQRLIIVCSLCGEPWDEHPISRVCP